MKTAGLLYMALAGCCLAAYGADTLDKELYTSRANSAVFELDFRYTLSLYPSQTYASSTGLLSLEAVARDGSGTEITVGTFTWALKNGGGAQLASGTLIYVGDRWQASASLGGLATGMYTVSYHLATPSGDEGGTGRSLLVGDAFTLSGRVTDAVTGQGIASATVSAGTQTTQTGAQGYYTLSNVSASDGEVTKNGYAVYRFTVNSPVSGMTVVRDVELVSEVAGLPVFGGRAQLAEIVAEHGVGEVIIALPEATHDELLDMIQACETAHAAVRIFPDLFQIIASELSIGDLDGLPMLTVRDAALRGWKLTVKRAMDVVLSGLGLMVLSPFLLLVALAIKLESKGPVFFTQVRVGLDGKPFEMVKFRSMRVDAEAQTGAVWATEDDPRRTRLGTILRKTSIDELPQLINVLLGDMSLVGPRPERPVFVDQFRQVVPRYMERHQEKAGMTGWAQVNGLRGDTSIIERTKYDLYYIENWSLLFDLKILVRTFVNALKGDRHAY